MIVVDAHNVQDESEAKVGSAGQQVLRNTVVIDMTGLLTGFVAYKRLIVG